MAVTLSITVTDAQAARAQTALGHRDANGQWVDATAAEIRALVKAFIKERVIDYETTLAAEADRATRSAEAW